MFVEKYRINWVIFNQSLKKKKNEHESVVSRRLKTLHPFQIITKLIIMPTATAKIELKVGMKKVLY